jgi:hypothetical protein
MRGVFDVRSISWRYGRFAELRSLSIFFNHHCHQNCHRLRPPEPPLRKPHACQSGGRAPRGFRRTPSLPLMFSGRNWQLSVAVDFAVVPTEPRVRWRQCGTESGPPACFGTSPVRRRRSPSCPADERIWALIAECRRRAGRRGPPGNVPARGSSALPLRVRPAIRRRLTAPLGTYRSTAAKVGECPLQQ